VAYPLDPNQAVPLAIMFKALSDPVRLRLLSLIASRPNGEACACELLPICDVLQPTVSHHLKILRDAGLLLSRRRSQRIEYRVVPDALACLSHVLHSGTGG
jgi:ArsR family transcriptional regulator